jgi:signal transduction histidine kinase
VDLTRAWLRDDEGHVRGAVWVLRDDTQQRARQREAATWPRSIRSPN